MKQASGHLEIITGEAREHLNLELVTVSMLRELESCEMTSRALQLQKN